MDNILNTEKHLPATPKTREISVRTPFHDRMCINYLPFANEHATLARKHSARLDWGGSQYLLQFGKKWTPSRAQHLAMIAVVRVLLPKQNWEWKIAEDWAALYQHAASVNVAVDNFEKWCKRQKPDISRDFIKRKVRARRAPRLSHTSSQSASQATDA